MTPLKVLEHTDKISYNAVNHRQTMQQLDETRRELVKTQEFCNAMQLQLREAWCKLNVLCTPAPVPPPQGEVSVPEAPTALTTEPAKPRKGKTSA